MSSVDLYRTKAAALEAEAIEERSPLRKMELDALALGYLRLAQQPQRNTVTENTVWLALTL